MTAPDPNIVYVPSAEHEAPHGLTFWAWLCHGKGDGWEERDKVIHDPRIIAAYRERPDLWRIEALYRGRCP
ncbi:hypothetical protein CHELA1G11_12901 [Hyphomicrobiales bacterium]|nr:hypothetical protein CHELA1G2_11409 [Hyphomicrobiales bacterium]CAH1667913.1 hypothetical protein CHELA1G11_12901 [Hyphomicrobiales bacterium]